VLEEIAAWVEKKKIEVANGGFSNCLTNIFGLGYVGSGISRWVYKKKNSRKVYKITNLAGHNISEYALFHGLEGTELQSLFARCYNISKNGMVLEQEYCAKRMPDFELHSFRDITAGIEGCLGFISRISGENKLCFDFHYDNIRINYKYEAKIIDYSPLLWPMPMERNFSLPDCISKLKYHSKRYNRHIKFFLDQERKLVLDFKDRQITAQ
jgi:hypothetical protein